MAENKEQIRRVILIGKTGNGKSSTGNSILGKEVFKSEEGFASVTQECERFSRFRSDVNREYTIVDTPGLFDKDQPFAKRALEIQRALEICPKPHAFLIILRPDTRYTEEEKLTLDMLRVIYGELFLNHAILVFTRGADYESDQKLNDALAKCETVMTLKSECGSRVARVENNRRIASTIREDLISIVLDMIEEVSDGGKQFYLYKSLDVHHSCLIQHLKNRKPNDELGEELEQLVKLIAHQFDEMEKEKNTWRPYLIGAVVGAGGAAFAGLAYTASVGTAAAAAAIGDTTAFEALGIAVSYVSPFGYTAVGAGVTLLGNLAGRFNPFR